MTVSSGASKYSQRSRRCSGPARSRRDTRRDSGGGGLAGGDGHTTRHSERPPEHGRIPSPLRAPAFAPARRAPSGGRGAGAAGQSRSAPRSVGGGQCHASGVRFPPRRTGGGRADDHHSVLSCWGEQEQPSVSDEDLERLYHGTKRICTFSPSMAMRSLHAPHTSSHPWKRRIRHMATQQFLPRPLSFALLMLLPRLPRRLLLPRLAVAF